MHTATEEPKLDYHADLTRDSHSSLQLFRASVERYAAIRIHKTMLPDASKPAMVFGSAFHCLLLEPEKFTEQYILEPKFDKRTTIGKEAHAAWLQEHGSKEVLSVEAWAMLPAMVAGVMRNRYARSAIEGSGSIEEPVEWTDDVSGLRLKCKPDIRLANGLIIDVKTTNDIDPEAWSRTVATFGYHRQAALYLDGCWQVHQADGPFVHIAVSKEPPHECAVYEVGSESLAIGRSENADTLAELMMRRDSGDWSGRWSADVTTVNLPTWYMRKAR